MRDLKCVWLSSALWILHGPGHVAAPLAFSHHLYSSLLPPRAAVNLPVPSYHRFSGLGNLLGQWNDTRPHSACWSGVAHVSRRRISLVALRTCDKTFFLRRS
ncbi:hypothetical protein DFP72DRAFT_913152 [Ephemerocybe angulata]|uniref:Uncharacterized protein n=1 Tax=Ephemerocybe angulata TaxID=980116 RepID=A0A8H6HND1_9AGAR|nr:hypothetical protein DFP72DRAFT_913152 [Tulosesus angulatus]